MTRTIFNMPKNPALKNMTHYIKSKEDTDISKYDIVILRKSVTSRRTTLPKKPALLNRNGTLYGL